MAVVAIMVMAAIPWLASFRGRGDGKGEVWVAKCRKLSARSSRFLESVSVCGKACFGCACDSAVS